MRVIWILSKHIKIVSEVFIGGGRVAAAGIMCKLLEVTGAYKMIVDVTGGREH